MWAILLITENTFSPQDWGRGGVVVFFLIYHIISTVSEKAAKDGSLDPILGMWMAIIVLTPLAAFLTYKSTTDSSLFDAEQYKLKIKQGWAWLLAKVKKKQTSK